jgi:hypothetical protein
VKKYTCFPPKIWHRSHPVGWLADKPLMLSVYFYLSTCQESGGTGLLYISVPVIAAIFAESTESVQNTLAGLETAGLIKWDTRNGAIWVVHQAEFNYTGPGPKPLGQIEFEVRECGPHPFLGDFAAKYAALFEFHRSKTLYNLCSMQLNGIESVPVNVNVYVNGSERGESERGAAEEVWAHWVNKCKEQGEPLANEHLTHSRARLIESRIEDGFTPEVLKSALSGIWLDDFFVSKQIVTLESALKDGKAVERFAKLGKKPQATLGAGWESVDFGNGVQYKHKEKTKGAFVGLDVAKRIDAGEEYFK